MSTLAPPSAAPLPEHFLRVSREFPCPICGKADWCMISKNGDAALCQRVESGARWRDAGYFHFLAGQCAVPPAQDAAEPLSVATVTDFVWRWQRAGVGRMPRLAESLGLSLRSLQSLTVGWSAEYNAYSFPMRDERNHFIGVRFRNTDGQKWSLSGGRNGLFYPAPLGKVRGVFLAEGATDTAALLGLGFVAVGRPNDRACLDMTLELVVSCGAAYIVVVADRDAAGQSGAKKYLDAIRKRMPAHVPVVAIAPRREKDARACVVAGADRATIVEVLRKKPSRHWELLWRT
jgi:hypothetical protein